jgi:hypothetical protein
MPGRYKWWLIVTDLFGNTIITFGLIRVYDWDYSAADSLHVADTDKCYRFAMAPNQGVGAAVWHGDQWLWPTAYTGTCKGFDAGGNTLSLVLNNGNGRFYRIGVKDVWQDRVGAYGGSDIPCSFKLKEHVAPPGEYQEIEHIESHIHMRPFWEKNRSESGFTSEGFLSNYALGLQMYENGEPTTPSAKLQQVPRYGDYVMRERVEARRLQLEVLIDVSSWRCIMAQQRMVGIDKAAGPDFDYPSETNWQYEFRTPDLWLSRDSARPTLNRATGSNFSGTHDVFGIGPDGYSNTALNFAVGQGLFATGCALLASDFTLSLWVGNIGPTPITLWRMDVSDGNTLTIRLVLIGATYAIQWNDGTTGDTRTLSWNGVGWVHIAVERNGVTLRVFENGVQLSATPMIDATLGYGGTVYFAENSICTIFDVRRVARAISAAALAYYYDDVVNNNGNGGLLPIRR